MSGLYPPQFEIVLSLLSHLKIFMDVDCSTITYETPPSTVVLSAVERAKAELTSVASNLTQQTLERWVRMQSNITITITITITKHWRGG